MVCPKCQTGYGRCREYGRSSKLANCVGGMRKQRKSRMEPWFVPIASSCSHDVCVKKTYGERFFGVWLGFFFSSGSRAGRNCPLLPSMVIPAFSPGRNTPLLVLCTRLRCQDPSRPSLGARFCDAKDILLSSSRIHAPLRPLRRIRPCHR